MHGRWVNNLLKGLNEIEIKYELYEFNWRKKKKLAGIIVISRDIQGCYISSAGNSKYIYNKSSICLHSNFK